MPGSLTSAMARATLRVPSGKKWSLYKMARSFENRGRKVRTK